MSTHRYPPTVVGTVSDSPSLHVDMGAQYISKFQSGLQGRGEEFEKIKETLYDELFASQILVPLTGTVEGERKDLTKSVVGNYVAPSGINSVVKHFLKSSVAHVNFQHQLESVELRDAVSGVPSRKVLCTASNGVKMEFDGVILTMPVPQILSLGGNFVQLIDPDTKAKLEIVRYSSRYALGLFFSSAISSEVSQFSRPKWSVKYFDDPVVRFVSWGWERDSDTSQASSTSKGRTLLVHTGVPFGLDHLEDDKTTVKDLIMDKVNTLIPGLPQASHSHLIRWRYSQVSQVYPGSPGCVVLSHDPLVVATGDGFSGSNFENCIWAAMSTLKALI